MSGWSGRKWSCHCRPEQDSRALQGAAKKQFKQAENNKEHLLEKARVKTEFEEMKVDDRVLTGLASLSGQQKN